MTVMHTTVTWAKPGRRHDAIALALEASKLLERHDGQRIMEMLTGSEGPVTTISSGIYAEVPL